MDFHLDHVALLVEDVELALRQVEALGLTGGPVEEFPGEGTREAYVGAAGRSARLLFMQPLGETGPYARALRKRGPGLHHLAILAPGPRSCLDSLPGWLLHPVSLETEASKTLWLARPGVPTLLEVCAGAATGVEPVVEGIEVPVPRPLERLLGPFRAVKPSPDGEVWLTLAAQRVSLGSLLDGR